MQVAAAGALRNLANSDEIRVKIAEAGAVPALVGLLGPHSTVAVQQAAVGALRNLVRNADIHAEISDVGAVTALLALSQAPSERIDEEDVLRLCSVCMDAPISVLLAPCGHIALCHKCCDSIRAVDNRVRYLWLVCLEIPEGKIPLGNTIVPGIFKYFIFTIHQAYPHPSTPPLPQCPMCRADIESIVDIRKPHVQLPRRA